MSAIDQGVFKGVAVVIDDDAFTRSDPNLVKILDAIEAAGGLTVIHEALPTSADFENYAHVAFVIMDWDLTPRGVMLPPDSRAAQFQLNVEFIREISKHRHAPVVIFTNEPLEDVHEVLEGHEDMQAQLKSGRLLIKDKADVGEHVYKVLNDWARSVPSVQTLKTWERQTSRALNQLFLDLQEQSPYWPVMLWETFRDDGTSPADELGRLITRLVSSRMDPLPIDLEPLVARLEDEGTTHTATYQGTLRSLLESERVLRNARLAENSIAPGDFFRKPNAQAIHINVRPECDLIQRVGGPTPKLYLLRGTRIDDSDVGVTADHGQIIEQDNHFTVFAMYDGANYRFYFKDVEIVRWPDWKLHRLGRLLPPFTTRLQQKYAAYLQRTGLPTVPKLLRPATGAIAGSACANDASSEADALSTVVPADPTQSPAA